MKLSAAVGAFSLFSTLVFSGCLGPPECKDLSLEEGGTQRCKIVMDEKDRELLIHLPPGFDPNVATPLVLSFHGRLSDNEFDESFTGWSQKADQEGFMVIYPQGWEKSWNAGGCCGPAQKEGIRDVAFVRAILDFMEQTVTVDTGAVFAAGFSNGSRMTYRLACEDAGRIIAFGTVGGTLSNLNMDTGEELFACNPQDTPSIIHIHGTSDTCNPYEGGDGKDTKNNRSVDDMQSTFKDKNDCPAGSSEIEVIGDTVCERWPQCGGGSGLEFCAINGGGHIWPGAKSYLGWRTCGGQWIDDINATNRIWDFFVQYRR